MNITKTIIWQFAILAIVTLAIACIGSIANGQTTNQIAGWYYYQPPQNPNGQWYKYRQANVNVVVVRYGLFGLRKTVIVCPNSNPNNSGLYYGIR